MRSLNSVTLTFIALYATSVAAVLAGGKPPKQPIPKDEPLAIVDCSTKGVLSRTGEKIYYLSYEPAWKQIEMKDHSDRIWICGGEDAALLKGYRPARYDNVFDE
jgi:hypothetical protein